jgi:hypothetical protein
MRYSADEKSVIDKARTHREFIELIVRKTKPEERGVGLLLVGGSSSRHESVRRAQAALRMDYLASYWSHAAIVLEWGQDPKKAIGAEVTWEPWRPELQVAERNAVTLFPLSRYLNEQQYPNLAFATFTFSQISKPKGAKDEVVDYRGAIRNALLSPNRDRFRYRFLDWLRIWGGYTYQLHGQPNPLLSEIPVPGAGLCEYAFEAAGIDLTPGATAPNACPELLWSTILYWHKRIGEHVQGGKIFTVLRDPSCQARKTLSMTLAHELSQGLSQRGSKIRRRGKSPAFSQ